jgi:oxygen-dependent protoporphyrinogen oxidase
VFHSFVGGMGRLVDALVEHLRAAGVDLRLDAAVDDLGDLLDSDAIVLAIPAHAAAGILSSAAPWASELLGTIEAASVALVIADYARDDVPGPLAGSGLLVPTPEGRSVSAVSWTSSKWPTVARDGRATLRISLGRDGDGPAGPVDLPDNALLGVVDRELRDLMGIVEPPLATRIVRWKRSFPQYRPGHLRLVAEIERTLGVDAPDVRVAGASYRGLGIPACIRQGREAAASLFPLADTA